MAIKLQVTMLTDDAGDTYVHVEGVGGYYPPQTVRTVKRTTPLLEECLDMAGEIAYNAEATDAIADADLDVETAKVVAVYDRGRYVVVADDLGYGVLLERSVQTTFNRW